ncbi:MAG: hypothetical protein VB035_14645 [Candidatus Fimivivens sp.]|nr:hypothetical protein [Candidatus Fimivivens sp.]
MKNKQVIGSFSKIKPDEVAKKRMLSNILSQSALDRNTNRKGSFMQINLVKKLVPIAACCAAVLVAAFAIPNIMDLNRTPQITIVTPAADSPMGIRKIMNYNGYRYAFLENGATYNLNKSEITKSLGKLEYDITKDPKNNGTKEFSATFAVGGTIYEIPSYNTAFRVAVEIDGNYYICENVDVVGDGTLDVSDYFKKANFTDIVDEIIIYDHFKQNALDTITGEKVKQMIEDLSKSAPVVLSNDDYERIGKAQKSGKSFLLSFELNDKTQYKIYVIPTLGISMIGDNKYTLTDEFVFDYRDLFNEYSQSFR